ncbi:hypothetical protein QQ054_07490 [Oscillatoria amoena NRMC-F 0135]|nr:hypothetical protein [Oscillatoria amoena NRMC-F 0135]
MIKKKGNEALQELIELHMEMKRAEVLEILKGKMLFETGNDGEPTHRRIEVMEKRASIQFHFMRSNDNTNYFPTLFYDGKKLELPNPTAYLICKEPA